MAESEVEKESREIRSFEKLWDAVYKTHLDAAYNEMLADRLIDRWQIVDDASKIAIAITASGSAISGWALWTHAGYRLFWIGLASSSALLGIVHSSLGVTARLREWGDIKRAFASLRVELETLKYRMQFDFKVGTAIFQRDFIRFRRQYLKAVVRLPNDLLLSKGLKDVTQRNLEKALERNRL